MRCTSTPISWLELERLALGEVSPSRTAEIRAHLSRCSACAGCWRALDADRRELPRLRVQAAPASRAVPWRYAIATFAVAAVVMLVLQLRRDDERSRISGIKGDALHIELLRERGGELLAPDRFAPGDRFKVQASCGEGSIVVDVVVEQGGQLYYPLAPARLWCGNRVEVPGAFHLDGGSARVCLVIGSDLPPARGQLPPGAVCTTVVPEVP